jgi:flavin reductase (DIM6/NTAB) family NADH-FMN oxidoreductase RutF
MPDGQTLTHPALPFRPEDDPRAFRTALGRFATGVAVVTAMGPDGPTGFTANSFAAVSLDPPLVLWSPARASSRFPVFAAAAEFAIHVLHDSDQDLSARFHRGGAGFAGLDHEMTAEGVPVIPGTLARFDCAHHAAHDGGDHLVILGRVRRAIAAEGAPLIFALGQFGTFRPG